VIGLAFLYARGLSGHDRTDWRLGPALAVSGRDIRQNPTRPTANTDLTRHEKIGGKIGGGQSDGQMWRTKVNCIIDID